mgnify:CR=1 FL=1
MNVNDLQRYTDIVIIPSLKKRVTYYIDEFNRIINLYDSGLPLNTVKYRNILTHILEIIKYMKTYVFMIDECKKYMYTEFRKIAIHSEHANKLLRRTVRFCLHSFDI